MTLGERSILTISGYVYERSLAVATCHMRSPISFYPADADLDCTAGIMHMVTGRPVSRLHDHTLLQHGVPTSSANRCSADASGFPGLIPPNSSLVL